MSIRAQALCIALLLPFSTAHSFSLDSIVDTISENKVAASAGCLSAFFLYKAWRESKNEQRLRNQLRSALAGMIAPEPPSPEEIQKEKEDEYIASLVDKTDVDATFLSHLLKANAEERKKRAEEKTRSAAPRTLSPQQRVIAQLRSEIDNSEKYKTLYIVLGIICAGGGALSWHSNHEEKERILQQTGLSKNFQRSIIAKHEDFKRQMRGVESLYNHLHKTNKTSNRFLFASILAPNFAVRKAKKISAEKEIRSIIKLWRNVANWRDKASWDKETQGYHFTTSQYGKLETIQFAKTREEAYVEAIVGEEHKGYLENARENLLPSVKNIKTRQELAKSLQAITQSIEEIRASERFQECVKLLAEKASKVNAPQIAPTPLQATSAH